MTSTRSSLGRSPSRSLLTDTVVAPLLTSSFLYSIICYFPLSLSRFLFLFLYPLLLSFYRQTDTCALLYLFTRSGKQNIPVS